MKKLALIFIFFFTFHFSNAQSISISQIEVEYVSEGINVNVKSESINGAGFLSYSYSIDGNSITLDVCYWFDNTLPVLTFDQTFFIPLANSGTYNLIVNGINSSSQTNCDNYSNTSSVLLTITFLSTTYFIKPTTIIYPNPFQNNFTIETEKTITNYSLFDLTGKKIIETFSKNEIDNFSSQLNSGVYFLNLEFENGQKTNHKLIKE
jgi:hypothetical protein